MALGRKVRYGLVFTIRYHNGGIGIPSGFTNSIRIGQRTQIGFGKQGAARSSKQATATLSALRADSSLSLSLKSQSQLNSTTPPFFASVSRAAKQKKEYQHTRRSDGLTPTDALHQVPRSGN